MRKEGVKGLRRRLWGLRFPYRFMDAKPRLSVRHIYGALLKLWLSPVCTRESGITGVLNRWRRNRNQSLSHINICMED